MTGTNPVSSSATTTTTTTTTTTSAQPIPPSDTITRKRSHAVYQNTVPRNQQPITNNLVGRVDPDAARMAGARSLLYSC